VSGFFLISNTAQGTFLRSNLKESSDPSEVCGKFEWHCGAESHGLEDGAWLHRWWRDLSMAMMFRGGVKKLAVCEVLEGIQQWWWRTWYLEK